MNSTSLSWLVYYFLIVFVVDASDAVQSARRRRFTPSEDALLLQQVINSPLYFLLCPHSQNPEYWNAIALNFPGRTARQCRERYRNYLRPDMTHTQISDSVLETMAEMRQQGKNVAEIQMTINNLYGTNYSYPDIRNRLARIDLCPNQRLDGNRQEVVAPSSPAGGGEATSAILSPEPFDPEPWGDYDFYGELF